MRVPYFDNARFCTIALVVIGHSIQRLTDDSTHALALYLFIYAFHMPAFAIISGYFSRAAPAQRQMRAVLTDILLPYVILQIIWTVVQGFVENDWGLNFTRPHWTLWFLIALALFRIALPYLALLRWPLLWAVIASVGVGYLDNVNTTMSLTRAVGFLPFFVLGWVVAQGNLVEKWQNLAARAWLVRAVAAAILVAWLIVIIVNIDAFRDFGLNTWFFYEDSYSRLHMDSAWAGGIRIGTLALGTVLCAAYFALIPRRQTIFTVFGQATMYVYLLHTFVLYPIRKSELLRDQSSDLWLAGLVVFAIALTVLLSTGVVRRVFRWVIEPRIPWLFTPPAEAPPESPR